jgi:8-oxo-dGTP pyrophosphatase MutT (NUDIX family)
MSIREERHKTITVLVSFIDDKPRFLTVRDRRHKDWIFITGGCRKRETSNPLRCALRELEEETRGVILLKEGSYSHFSFVHNTRTPEEEEQDRTDDLDVIVVYNVSRFSRDAVYGIAPRSGGPPLHLHAREITIPLPRDAPVRVVAPVPDHMHDRLVACGLDPTPP